MAVKTNPTKTIEVPTFSIPYVERGIALAEALKKRLEKEKLYGADLLYRLVPHTTLRAELNGQNTTGVLRPAFQALTERALTSLGDFLCPQGSCFDTFLSIAHPRIVAYRGTQLTRLQGIDTYLNPGLERTALACILFIDDPVFLI